MGIGQAGRSERMPRRGVSWIAYVYCRGVRECSRNHASRLAAGEALRLEELERARTLEGQVAIGGDVAAQHTNGARLMQGPGRYLDSGTSAD